MQMTQNLASFFQSRAFLDFYEKFFVVGFWISVPVCLFMAVLIIRVGKKYNARKNELEKAIHFPDMEDVRWIFKGKLKEHGIEPDEHVHEKN